jgi:death-on-curing protein
MEAPRFLALEEVLEIHQDQIARYGGSAGVRDIGLLDSAVRSPEATFAGQFLLNGIFEMAAVYLVHLVKNHAFIDGNKRVGTAAALTFLQLNGISIREDEPALSDLVLGVAKGGVDRAAVIA